MERQYIKGSQLPEATQREALAAYIHRYTKDHRPAWSRGEWKDGKPYPVQFASDQEWLATTLFPVTKTGSLAHGRGAYCQSSPTWPDNPELRRVEAVQ